MGKFERDLDRWIEREDPAIAEQDAYDKFVDYHLEKGNCKIVDNGDGTDKIVWLKEVEIRDEYEQKETVIKCVVCKALEHGEIDIDLNRNNYPVREKHFKLIDK